MTKWKLETVSKDIWCYMTSHEVYHSTQLGTPISMLFLIHGCVTLWNFCAPHVAEGYLFRGYLLAKHESKVPYNYFVWRVFCVALILLSLFGDQKKIMCPRPHISPRSFFLSKLMNTITKNEPHFTFKICVVHNPCRADPPTSKYKIAKPSLNQKQKENVH